MKKLSKEIMLVAFIVILSASCNDDDTSETSVDNSITGIASRNANLSILVQALGKAGLASTLQGSGPYTVLLLQMMHSMLSWMLMVSIP